MNGRHVHHLFRRAATRTTIDAGRRGGGSYLITSKNTLENGSINPAEPVDKRLLVDLGVGHDAFVRALDDLLQTGGLVDISNLSPTLSRKGEAIRALDRRPLSILTPPLRSRRIRSHRL